MILSLLFRCCHWNILNLEATRLHAEGADSCSGGMNPVVAATAQAELQPRFTHVKVTGPTYCYLLNFQRINHVMESAVRLTIPMPRNSAELEKLEGIVIDGEVADIVESPPSRTLTIVAENGMFREGELFQAFETGQVRL